MSYDKQQQPMRFGTPNSDVAQGKTNELIHAIRDKNIDKVQHLIKSGAKVNAADHEKMTPLMFAVLAQDTAIIRLLLEHNANLSMSDLRGVNAVMLACKDLVPVTVLQELLKNPAATTNEIINAKNIVGATSLMWAAAFGDEAKLNLLLKAGADKNLQDHEGHTAADWAAHDRKAKCFEILTGQEFSPQKRKF